MTKSKILNRRELSDLEMLAIGALAPLQRFLGQKNYESVVKHMRLIDGQLWPIPIILSVIREETKEYKVGEPINLLDGNGEKLAELELEEKYTYDKDWKLNWSTKLRKISILVLRPFMIRGKFFFRRSTFGPVGDSG